MKEKIIVNNEILLNKVMQVLVDKHVKAYKGDFNYDIAALLDKNSKTNKFYWLIRECGTDLCRIPAVYIKGEYDNYLANYHIQNTSSNRIYEINITRRGRKNFYGTISKIKKETFLKLLKEEEILPKNIESVEVLILTTDGKKKEERIPYSDNIFFDILKKLNIKREEVVSYYTKYVF